MSDVPPSACTCQPCGLKWRKVTISQRAVNHTTKDASAPRRKLHSVILQIFGLIQYQHSETVRYGITRFQWFAYLAGPAA